MVAASKKICLVGDYAVGKTSLIRRFVDNQFSDQYLSTVGVKLSRKNIKLPFLKHSTEFIEEKENTITNVFSHVQLLIWDLEGSFNFRTIASTYLKGSAGVVVVGDLTRSETIQNINDHIKHFFSVNPEGFAVVALNKADVVSAEILSKQVHFEDHNRVLMTLSTSAKTGKNVDQIFEVLARKIMEVGS
jgi:small GTP-binding protein